MIQDGKHKKNDMKLPNTVLYRARKRSSVYNDFIPLSEQNKRKENVLLKKISEAGNKIKNVFSFKLRHKPTQIKYDPQSAGAVSRRARMSYAAKSGAAFFASHFFISTVLICGIIIALSFILIPIAFAQETKTVYLNDGGREFVAETAEATVGEFLERNGIVVGEDDYLETPAETVIEDESTIIIRRAMDLTIKNGTESTAVTMVAGTVADALNMAGIAIEEGDEIYPAENTYVRSGMTIDYINVDVEFVTETKPVGFKEVTVETDELYKGEQKITQEGQEGSKEITYKQVYKNGVLYSSDVYDEVITKEPVNEILSVGTKEKPQPKPETSSPSKPNKPSGGSSSGGNSSGGSSSGGSTSRPQINTNVEGAPAEIRDQVAYAVKSTVTAYCSNCDSSGVGSSGAYLTDGSLSADTSMFPYGTRIYIPGYGIGYVVDTGGAIKGTRIDVYMGTQDSETVCNNWGRRTLTVYVLK